MDCFREDFTYRAVPLWGQQHPDSCWFYDIEEHFHEGMFGFVDGIDLEFTGNSEYPWTGDSTGQTPALERYFDMDVYYTVPGPPYEGSCASGSVLFVCRPDSNGDWYVWQWRDYSDIPGQKLEACTWTGIKILF
jgi:hypothetical protein